MDPQQGNAVVLPYTRTTRRYSRNQPVLAENRPSVPTSTTRASIVTGCCGTSWWRRVGLRKICCPRGRTPYTTRPWIAMPAEGRRFKPIGLLAVPGWCWIHRPRYSGPFNTASGNELVPVGYDGVITDVVCGIEPGAGGSGAGFVEGSGDLIWRLSASGRFLRDHGNIKTSLGSLTSPSPVPRGGIRVWSEDILQFFVAFAPGADARINATSKIVVSITGWFYPR